MNTAIVIDFAGSLIITLYALRAALTALRSLSVDQSRRILTTGVIIALDFKLGATLLKTMMLASWQPIGMFATIFAIRFVLKRTFAMEYKKLPERY